MADSYALDGEFIEWIISGVTAAIREELEVPAYNLIDPQEEGIWVELTELGDTTTNGGDFSMPCPYKAKAVQQDKDNAQWNDSAPAKVFDPDADPADYKNIPLYVYAMNGGTHLVGTRQYIKRYAWENDTFTDSKPVYWGFEDQPDYEIAEIIDEVSPGLGEYTAYQLDADLTQTGNQYGIEFPNLQALGNTTAEPGDKVIVFKKGGNFYFFQTPSGEEIVAELTGPGSTAGTYAGNWLDGDLNPIAGRVFGTDLPFLIEASGREHLGNERVLVHRSKDSSGDYQYIFRWDDPQMIIGSDGSPPDDSQGIFKSFFEGLGATLGITRNFRAASGVYEFNELYAIGPPSQSGTPGAGFPNGVKIEQLSDNKYSIQLIDMNGDVIPPYDPLDPPVIPPWLENAGPYCAELEWNDPQRKLKIITKDAQGVEICSNEVMIPCCDDGGGGYDYPDDPEGPYPPPVPPEPPYEPPYDDDCPPPLVRCTPDTEPICLPNTNNEIVSRMSIDLNGTDPASYDLTLTEVLDPEGNAVALNNWRFSTLTGVLATDNNYSLLEGTYIYRVTVTNTGSVVACTWSNFDVACHFVVKDCECNEDDTSTGGDTPTDNCPSDCSDIDISLDDGACVLLGGDLETNTGRMAEISIDMDLDYQGYLRSGRKLSDPKKPGEENKAKPLYQYRKRVTFNKTFTVDADASFREEFLIPIQSLSRSNNRGKASTLRKNGKLEVRYVAFPEGNERLLVKYIDGFSYIVPVVYNNTTKQYERSDTKEGNGTISATLTIRDEVDDSVTPNTVGTVRITDPCEDTWTFTLGGVDASKFELQEVDGKSARIIQKSGINYVNPSYALEITAVRDGSPACTKFLSTTIYQCSVFDGVETTPARQTGGSPNTATAAGRQGETVTTFRATNGGGIVQSDVEVDNVEWVVSRQTKRNDSATEADLTDEYFHFISYPNGEADLVANVDLQEGTYEFDYEVRNAQMKANNEILQGTFTVTVDKTTGEYKRPELRTSSGSNGGLA